MILNGWLDGLNHDAESVMALSGRAATQGEFRLGMRYRQGSNAAANDDAQLIPADHGGGAAPAEEPKPKEGRAAQAGGGRRPMTGRGACSEPELHSSFPPSGAVAPRERGPINHE